MSSQTEGQKQDLEKAIHYCQMAIDRDYPEKEVKPTTNTWGITNEDI